MTFFYKNERLAGMGQLEASIYTKFLDAEGDKYFNIRYNFKLVRPLNIPKDFPEEYKNLAFNNTSFRVDAITEDKDKFQIIEVRPSATSSAVGSLILYKFLFNLQEQPNKIVTMALVTDRYEPAMEITCRAIQIRYLVY